MILQIPFQDIPQWLTLAVSGATLTAGVYVSLRTDVGLLKQHVAQLEDRLKAAETRLNDHDDDIHRMILKVQEDITEIKLMIAKNQTHP